MQHQIDITNRAHVKPELRQKERDEIARLTAEWEKQHGKVKTLPIIKAVDATSFNNGPKVIAKSKPEPEPRKPREKVALERAKAFLKDPKNKGMSRSEVMAAVGVSNTTASVAAGQAGYKFRMRPTKQDAILALADAHTVAEIIKLTGASDGHTRSVLKAAGKGWKK